AGRPHHRRQRPLGPGGHGLEEPSEITDGRGVAEVREEHPLREALQQRVDGGAHGSLLVVRAWRRGRTCLILDIRIIQNPSSDGLTLRLIRQFSLENSYRYCLFICVESRSASSRRRPSCSSAASASATSPGRAPAAASSRLAAPQAACAQRLPK